MRKLLLFLSLILTGCGGSFQTVAPPRLQAVSQPSSGEPLYGFIRQLSTSYVGKGTIIETGDKKFPSLVLGVVSPKGKAILTFGLTPKGSTPSPKDIYPLSSISKMLTGLILARGVDEGSYRLIRPLHETLPADLAPYVGEKTLGMAASHYASFKAKPTNLDQSNVDAPAATYTTTALATCLASSACSTIPASPGTAYLYSDLGIGVLGHALVNFYKKASYEDLLRDRLTVELGMTDTSALLEHYKTGYNVVGGFRPTDEAVKPATMGALVAAGGVLSSGEDMLKLLSEVVNPSSRWRNTLKLAMTPIMPGVGFAIDITTIESMELHSKSGEQAGYSSLIMWNKKTGAGVYALANRGMGSKSLAKFLIKIHKRISENP